MKNKQAGFLLPFLIVVALVVLGAGIYYKTTQKNKVEAPLVSDTQTQTSDQNQQTVTKPTTLTDSEYFQQFTEKTKLPLTSFFENIGTASSYGKTNDIANALIYFKKAQSDILEAQTSFQSLQEKVPLDMVNENDLLKKAIDIDIKGANLFVEATINYKNGTQTASNYVVQLYTASNYITQGNSYIDQATAAMNSTSTQSVGVSLDECINTKDQGIKYACGMNLAVKLKDRSICQKVYGNKTHAYYCQEAYDSVYGYTPTTITECQFMVTTDGGDFYKDDCFRGIAQTTLNPEICKYLSTAGQAACVVQVNNDIYTKKNLCGPLFINNNIPSPTKCVQYVESLHDVNKCNFLTRAQGPEWEKATCILNANQYNSGSGDTSKNIQTSLNHATFDCGTSDYANLTAQSNAFNNSTCFNKQFAMCAPAQITGIANGGVSTEMVVGSVGNQCKVTLTQSTQNSSDPAIVWDCLFDPSKPIPTSPSVLQKLCIIK